MIFLRGLSSAPHLVATSTTLTLPQRFISLALVSALSLSVALRAVLVEYSSKLFKYLIVYYCQELFSFMQLATLPPDA
jgi:hypothetical protein